MPLWVSNNSEIYETKENRSLSIIDNDYSVASPSVAPTTQN